MHGRCVQVLVDSNQIVRGAVERCSLNDLENGDAEFREEVPDDVWLWNQANSDGRDGEPNRTLAPRSLGLGCRQ